MDEPPGIVPVDLPCLRCRYSLRAISATGICPECTLPVVRSLDPDRLLLADPRWLGRVSLGALLLVAGIPGYLVLMTVFMLLAEFVGVMDETAILWVIMFALLPVLLLIFVTLATAPDRRAGAIALAARWVAILASAAMVAVCSTYPLWIEPSDPLLPHWSVPFVAVVGSLTVAFGTASCWWTLARRELERRLTIYSAVIAVWAPVMAVLLGLLLLLAQYERVGRLLPLRIQDYILVLMWFMTLVGVVGWFVTGILACRYLRRCRRRAVDPSVLPPIPGGARPS